MTLLSEQVRLRLREEMERRDLSQRDVANLLKWSQSKVAHILTAHVELRIDDLGAICFALGLSPVEAVRDHGLEFCATMTPTELRVLERFRQLPAEDAAAFLQIFRVATKTRLQERRAAPRVQKTKSRR